jgi:hypothetical protein
MVWVLSDRSRRSGGAVAGDGRLRNGGVAAAVAADADRSTRTPPVTVSWRLTFQVSCRNKPVFFIVNWAIASFSEPPAPAPAGVRGRTAARKFSSTAASIWAAVPVAQLTRPPDRGVREVVVAGEGVVTVHVLQERVVDLVLLVVGAELDFVVADGPVGARVVVLGLGAQHVVLTRVLGTGVQETGAGAGARRRVRRQRAAERNAMVGRRELFFGTES